MKTALLIATGIAASISLAAEARISTSSQFTGYKNCIEAAEKEYAAGNQYHGLVTQRHYFLNQSDESDTYFINATAWQDGSRVPVAITCETTESGRKVAGLSTVSSRFALGTGEGVQVAGQQAR